MVGGIEGARQIGCIMGKSSQTGTKNGDGSGKNRPLNGPLEAPGHRLGAGKVARRRRKVAKA